MRLRCPSRPHGCSPGLAVARTRCVVRHVLLRALPPSRRPAAIKACLPATDGSGQARGQCRGMCVARLRLQGQAHVYRGRCTGRPPCIPALAAGSSAGRAQWSGVFSRRASGAATPHGPACRHPARRRAAFNTSGCVSGIKVGLLRRTDICFVGLGPGAQWTATAVRLPGCAAALPCPQAPTCSDRRACQS